MKRSAWVLCFLAAAACGDDADDGAGAADASSADAAIPAADAAADAAAAADSGAGDAATAAGEPLYVVSTGTVAGDDFIGYLATVPSLEPGAEYDLDDAAEIGTGSFIFGREREGAVYVASLAEPTITRWEIEGPGKFHKGKTVSFADLGFFSAYLAASAPIFSDEKSYFVDDEQDQVVIWNPARMELIGTIPLGDEDDGALMPVPEGAIVARGDRLLVTVGWRDPDDTTHFGDHVRVVAIDTRTDGIVDSSTDERSVHAALSATKSDGTAFYSPFSLYAAYRGVGDGHGAPSTLLRVAPDKSRFDAAYSVDLSELVGGRPAGDFTLLDDDVALIRVWHPELVDAVDESTARDVIRSQAGFLWWRWQVGDGEAVQIEDQAPSSLGSSLIAIDGKTYATSFLQEEDTTTLVEITDEGEFVPVLHGPGQIVGSGVMRVR
jgi:hypothetical protein